MIHDLWAGHTFLALNEYSSATIGMHSYLLRDGENDRFTNFFHQGINMRLQTEGFITQLNDNEKGLSNKCQLDIERCAMITRLRKCLEENKESFQNILIQIQIHLRESMHEDVPLAPPRTIIEFIHQCNQRNEAADKLHQAHRMRRLLFHDNNDTKQSMNAFNLQNWILTHFQLFLNIIPTSPNRALSVSHLEALIKNSFFIIQHPSPPIATHSKVTKDGVTAEVRCRLLCILNRSNPAITINNIIPFVHRLTTSSQTKESDVVYQQPQMNWKTYSIMTASNNYKVFSCAEMSEIILKQTSVISGNQNPSTGKTHHAPFVYRIDFCIDVTVHFPNDPNPHQQRVTVQSAPFGLISNTSQKEDLFARVFIEDLKSWKSESTPLLPLTTVLENRTFPATVTNSRIEEIVNGIERYFIHKTGIRPKDWIIPYIRNVLTTTCHEQSGSIDSLCHNYLVKILAQIDYMAEHPLLTLFHDDGLFLAICDSDEVSRSVFRQREYCAKSICAIRFGAMSRMSTPKDIGVRVNLLEKSSINPQNYTFDAKELSLKLGLYIIKIRLCEAAQFDSVLTSLCTNVGDHGQNTQAKITKFVELYYSDKLLEICPHEDRYHSIWHHFYNKENNKPSQILDLSPNLITTTTTETNSEMCYGPENSNVCAVDQTQSYYYQEYPLQPYYPQPQVSYPSETQLYETFSNLPQYSIAPQMNQPNINPPPIIIVVTNPNYCIMSNEDVTHVVSNYLPQYSEVIRSSPFYRIDADQTFNAPTQILSPNSISTDDLLNFLQ